MTVLGARIDGVLSPPHLASIPVTDEGLLRGDGVFEVIRVYGGQPFALDEHLDRMARSAAAIRLHIDLDALSSDIEALDCSADEPDALIRLVCTRGGHRIALLEPIPALPDAVRLATVPYSPSCLLDGVKTISYAANSLATRIAGELGADQALLIAPDGRVLEGPNFAVFLAFDDHRLTTPPLTEGILDSITRRHLLDLVPAHERPVAKEELTHVKEAFIASTIREVLPVSHIDGAVLPQVPGPQTQQAERRFRTYVAEQVAAAAGARATTHRGG